MFGAILDVFCFHRFPWFVVTLDQHHISTIRAGHVPVVNILWLAHKRTLSDSQVKMTNIDIHTAPTSASIEEQRLEPRDPDRQPNLTRTVTFESAYHHYRLCNKTIHNEWPTSPICCRRISTTTTFNPMPSTLQCRSFGSAVGRAENCYASDGLGLLFARCMRFVRVKVAQQMVLNAAFTRRADTVRMELLQRLSHPVDEISTNALRSDDVVIRLYLFWEPQRVYVFASQSRYCQTVIYI